MTPVCFIAENNSQETLLVTKEQNTKENR